MPDHDQVANRGKQRRVLWVALAANGAFMVAEIVGGFVFGSLALLADAAHMVTDVFGLGVALVAQSLAMRPPSVRHTFGLQRAEVLGAQVNGLTLLAASAWIFYEAMRRLADPPEVVGGGVVTVAALGLCVNAGSAALIGRVRGRTLNMRGAFLHMAVDALGSLGAIFAGVAVLVWNAAWADPAISMLIGLLVLWSAWRLLKDTTHVLLEGTPRGMSVEAVERAIESDDAVEAAHHVHLWNLASDVPAVSAHVVLTGDGSLHDAQLQADRLKAMLHDRFGIEHATLQLECHACEPEHQAARGLADRARRENED